MNYIIMNLYYDMKIIIIFNTFNKFKFIILL